MCKYGGIFKTMSKTINMSLCYFGSQCMAFAGLNVFRDMLLIDSNTTFIAFKIPRICGYDSLVDVIAGNKMT